MQPWGQGAKVSEAGSPDHPPADWSASLRPRDGAAKFVRTHWRACERGVGSLTRVGRNPSSQGSQYDDPNLRVIPRSPAGVGRRGTLHCLESTQSEIPLPRLRDRNDGVGAAGLQRRGLLFSVPSPHPACDGLEKAPAHATLPDIWVSDCRSPKGSTRVPGSDR